MEKILAIIPARGGSKRVPKKNIRELKGKPLIAWTIEAAENSKLIDDFIVSTDDDEIDKVCLKYGSRVLKRPNVLARDWSKTIDVMLDVLRVEHADIVVCLQPTSPFRTASDIDNAIDIYKHSRCESLISVCEAGKNQCWMMKQDRRYITPIFGHKYFNRQKTLPKVYVPNGAIFISTPSLLNKYRTFYSNYIIPYVMPPERSVDIDDFKDFVIAESMK